MVRIAIMHILNKKVLVTVPGKLSSDIPVGTLKSILKQAGLN